MMALLRAVGSAVFLILVSIFGFPGFYPEPLQFVAVFLCVAMLLSGAASFLFRVRRDAKS